MGIAWKYLDKKSAAADAVKDYSSMKFIIEHTDDEIKAAYDKMGGLSSPQFDGMPHAHNPHATEDRMAEGVDEISVLRERYRQAMEYMAWFVPAWEELSEDDRYVLDAFYSEENEYGSGAAEDVADYFGIERASACTTPHLYEQRIRELFLEALGILMENREEVIGDCRAVMEALADCGPIDAEMEAVSDEMEVTAGLIQKLVDENATRKLDQHDYRKKYDGYASRYAALESRMDSLEKEWERKEIQYDIFSGFLAGLSETEELSVDFNEKLFHRLVDYATVYPDGRVVFTFRNGAEVSTEI